jgi:arabinogalactan oligomer/maltooligosaccharide transport system substrate-binding protein
MKKYLALVLALILCVSVFAGCNKPAEKTATDVKIWVAEEIVELTKSQVAKFNELNPDMQINATVEAVGEGDAATAMTTDVEAGADIFCFAQDQTARLIQAGALSQLGKAAAELVTKNNDSASVGAVTAGDAIYGYPLTSDNGYFMYYDKSVIGEDIIDSMEDIIAACEAAGKNFSFELENSWYIVSFFFATGCDSTWETDAEGNFIKVNDTFNSDKGLLACEGMAKLVTSKCFVNSSQTADFEAATPSAVVVSGTWNYENAKSILGDNMGVADLPSFTAGGNSYHLASFNGCKLMGVKPQQDAERAAIINKLAQYLSGEECQLERFNAKGWGPSNLNAQKSDAVAAAPHLLALMQQNNFSQPQGQIHGSWWDIAKVIATSLKNGTPAQEALDTYKASMNALFEMTEEEKNAWGVVGSWADSNWVNDYTMVKQEDGTWKSEVLTFDDTTEFKVRQGKSWDVNYGMNGVAGGDNVTLAGLGLAAGSYYVVFDPATGIISLVAA